MMSGRRGRGRRVGASCRHDCEGTRKCEWSWKEEWRDRFVTGKDDELERKIRTSAGG